MNKIVSFIIPAYNSEKFLHKCLDSFVKADAETEKIEVLVISDGSTDRTADIAREYVAEYPDIVRLIEKANGGHGSGINVGSANVKGKYFKVIDADDWVDTSVLPEFVRSLEKIDADLVLTHYRTLDVTTKEEVEWKVHLEDFGRVYTLADVEKDWSSMGDCLTFHGITYKTEFYRSYGIQLSEKVFYEDHQFATIPACFAHSIRAIDTELYVYRIGDVNQSVSDANQYKRRGHMRKVIEDMMTFYRNAQSSMTKHGKYYYTEKLGRLMLAYYTTLFMTSPSFAEGRKEAEAFMEEANAQVPEICAFIDKRYRMMRILNILHINKAKFQKLLQSRLYKMIKGER